MQHSACCSPESIDGPEVAGVPDVEGGVKHVGLLQLVQLVLVVPELTVQGPGIGQDVMIWPLIG